MRLSEKGVEMHFCAGVQDTVGVVKGLLFFTMRRGRRKRTPTWRTRRVGKGGIFSARAGESEGTFAKAECEAHKCAKSAVESVRSGSWWWGGRELVSMRSNLSR